MINAYRKARYWTCYSLGAGDLLADSGTASHELKLDVGAWCLSAALLLAAMAGAGPAGVAAAAMMQAAGVYANRRLLDAFRRARGVGFATAAALYYHLVYPAAVLAGALSGAWLYQARVRGAAKPA